MAEVSAALRYNPSVKLHWDSELIPSRTERQLGQSKGIQKGVRVMLRLSFLIKSRIFDNIVLATLLSGDVVLACCSK